MSATSFRMNSSMFRRSADRHRAAPGLDGARVQALAEVEIREPGQRREVRRLEIDGGLVLVDRLVPARRALQHVREHEVQLGARWIADQRAAQPADRVLDIAVVIAAERIGEERLVIALLL